jgi:hypothetical protein
MSVQSFKPRVYLKDGCPFSFKLWLFLVEAGIADEVEVIRCNPQDPQFDEVKRKLASGLGAQASFPTAEIEPGRYRSDSGKLIEHFSRESGVSSSSLPALAFYEQTIFPQVVELHERNERE